MLVQGSDKLGAIGHGWTYSAHPICAAAGVANLELIDEMDLVANAGETGAYFRGELAKAVGGHPNVGEVRGEGMLAAVEFVADRDDRTLLRRLAEDRPADRRRAGRTRRHRAAPCRRATFSASRRRFA